MLTTTNSGTLVIRATIINGTDWDVDFVRDFYVTITEVAAQNDIYLQSPPVNAASEYVNNYEGTTPEIM